jgi:hypothetical protein
MNLQALAADSVKYVVIGSMAMAAQGLPRAAHDLASPFRPTSLTWIPSSGRCAPASTSPASKRSTPRSLPETIRRSTTTLPTAVLDGHSHPLVECLRAADVSFLNTLVVTGGQIGQWTEVEEKPLPGIDQEPKLSRHRPTGIDQPLV